MSFGIPELVDLDGCPGRALLKVFSEDLRDTSKSHIHNEGKVSEGGGKIMLQRLQIHLRSQSIRART